MALLCNYATALAATASAHIHGSKVNLRSAPGGAVLRRLDDGSALVVTERKDGWCHVTLPDSMLNGWVSADYIAESAAPSGPTAEKDSRAPVVEASFTPAINATDVLLPNQCVNPSPTKLTPNNETPSKHRRKSAAALSFREVKLTSPGKLGSAAYRSAGGQALASIGASSVNLRAQPALDADVLGHVDSGDRAYVIANADPWYLVSVPAKKLKGWVFGDYVDVLPRVAIKADDVRLRENPGTDGRVKDKLARGDVFYKLAAKDGWVQVASSASGLAGWVKAEYVARSDASVSRPYTVTGDQVNFRAAPQVDADVIARLPAGAQVSVLGRTEKWSYAWFSGHKGWLYSDYLAVGGARPSGPQEDNNNVRAPERKTLAPNADETSALHALAWKQVGGAPDGLGGRLIMRARAMLGTPYVWGGESSDGVDCSGLICKLLCDEGCAGKCLPRRASEQMAQLGSAVDKEDLLPGDLVFFTTYKPGPSHVGIYLGDGDFIHASSAQRQVAVSNLSERYYRERFCGARRLSEAELKTLR